MQDQVETLYIFGVIKTNVATAAVAAAVAEAQETHQCSASSDEVGNFRTKIL